MKYHTQWEANDVSPGGGTSIEEWSRRFDAAATVDYLKYILNGGIGGAATVMPIKRRFLRTAQTGAGAGRGVLSWDRIDGDPARADGEILALYIVGSNRESAAYLAARGSTGATTAYYAGLEPSADTIRIGKVVAGVNTSLASVGMSLPAPAAGANPASSAFWIRFRFQGANLSLTVWAVDTPEPSAPSLTAADGAIAAAGFYGVWNSGASTQGAWNSFACRTGSGIVPRPITETEYDAWLVRQNVERCAIAEFSATGFSPASADYTKVVPFYLSNTGYISHEQDTPSSRSYPAGMESVPETRQELGLALRGRASQGFGQFQVKNKRLGLGEGGERDSWPRMKWKKSTITVQLGDPSWPRHDFRPFFVGRLKPPKGADNDSINFDLGELAEAYADQLQTNVFSGGAGLNFEGEYLPLAIGRPRFVEPPLFDSTNNKYKLHDGAIVDQMLTWVYTDGPLVMADGSSLSNIAAKTITVVDTVNDRITVAGHGASVNAVMIFTGATPAPLAPNTRYYVITVISANVVELSATRGGAKINITGGTVGAGVSIHSFDIDASVGELALIAAASGRIVVGYVEQSGTNQERIANMIDWIVFTKLGLPQDYRDDDTLSALETAMLDDGYDAGIWIDRRGSTAAAALDQVCNRSNTWITHAPDGVLEAGRIELPLSTAVRAFTDKDVAQGTLRQLPSILPIDFTQTRTRYRPVWLTGGPYFVAGVEASSLLEPKYSYGAAGTPIDTAPQGDTQPKAEFDTVFEDGTLEQARLATLFQKTIGVFSFSTHLGAMRVKLGQTIQLVHPRKGWKVYTASDGPSPDNPAAFDATKAVVIGKEVNLGASDPLQKVTLTVFRQVPQYAPETAEDMPGFDWEAKYSTGTLAAADGGVPTLTRATAAWELDNEGLIHQAKSGEARWRGWRREENLVAGSSQDFSVAAWTKTNVTVAGDKQTLTASAGNGEVTQAYAIPAALGGGDYRPRFKITRVGGAGLIQVRMGGTYTTIAVGSTPVSFTAPVAAGLTGVLTWGLRIVTNGDSIKVEYAGLHDVSGRAIQAPPEEVSVGVLAAPFHGTAVDGVKVFPRANGNTVSSNVITDLDGALISWGTLSHLHLEPYAVTNTIVAPRDLTNVAWVKTNMTAVRAIGADGRANAASSLTSTNTPATCIQVLPALGGAADRRFGVYVKRLVGVGTVEITIDNVFFTAVSGLINSSGFTIVGVGKNAANRSVGFRLGTIGDSIAVDFGLEEPRLGGHSSPIDTAVVATRNAETLVYATAALDKQQGVQFAEFAADQDYPLAATMYPLATDTPNEVRIDALNTVAGYLGASRAVSAGYVWAARKPVKVVHRWDANRDDIWTNGVQGTPGAGSGFAGNSTSLYVGSNAAGAGVGLYLVRVGVMRAPLTDDLAKDLST